MPILPSLLPVFSLPISMKKYLAGMLLNKVSKKFVPFMPRNLRIFKTGVEINRLDKKLAQIDIDKLCQAIDPSADLDFDYLGIQTLYDRYSRGG